MTRYQPLWQQAGSYPAGIDRQLLASLWPNGGVKGGAVTAVNNTMNVWVAPGTIAVVLQGGQGNALCMWDAAEVVTLTAAPPSGQSRIDLIVAQVRDAALDGGANNDFVFMPIAGAPVASNPVAPALPTNAYPVATVLVGGAVANLNTATIGPGGSRPLVPGSVPARCSVWRVSGWTAAADGLNPPLAWEQSDDPWKMANLATGLVTLPFAGVVAFSWALAMSISIAVGSPNLFSQLSSPAGTEFARGSQHNPAESSRLVTFTSVGTAVRPVTAGQVVAVQPFIQAPGATKSGFGNRPYCYLDLCYLATT
jgi:hypothetical protein